jgi:hypothetical protein
VYFRRTGLTSSRESVFMGDIVERAVANRLDFRYDESRCALIFNA